MKKVRFTDIKKARWALPAGIVVLGVITIAAGQAANRTPKAALTEPRSTTSQSQDSESPAPTASPKIKVNGKEIPTDTDGSTDIKIGDGTAQVEVSDGHTRITTSNSTSSEQSGDTSNQESNKVQIDLNSTTSGGGKNTGKTRVFDSTYSSNNGSTSYNSTHVFSTASDHVSIKQK